MENPQYTNYIRGLKVLYYEFGKLKAEIENKINTLQPLLSKHCYLGCQHTSGGEFTRITAAIASFETDLKSGSNVNLEATANALLAIKFKLDDCESKMFACLRSNIDGCIKCNK